MALLDLENVSRHFGGLRAVADVSFSVDSGEILGLIGPNGAGKTTAFNLITGFLAPSSGRIRFGGVDIAGAKPHAVARLGIARTFQIVKPFPRLSTLDNVMLAALARKLPRADARAQAERALELVGLADRLHTPAAELTYSNQKRMEIARALATAPKLLLLDEPMGGLNAHEVDGACTLVERIRTDGVTVILVEHVMKAIMRISHRIVVMNQGQKIADGAPGDIVKNADVIAAYFGKRTA